MPLSVGGNRNSVFRDDGISYEHGGGVRLLMGVSPPPLF
jgi:hypothetical protein